ncbi:MAG: FMN-binding protein, partial [Lachnospiraceae bacterium]|nr:FMN-binding protein [Lachnospiraceae bacterium]
AIKELYIFDYDDTNETNVNALQKLANNSKDKYNANEVDTITGATETSDTYKRALNNALGYKEKEEYDDLDRVSLKEEENIRKVERIQVEQINNNAYKTGLGAFIQNHLVDAEYNKNGELVTHEYICAVMLQQNNRVMSIKFDHIASNMNFDSFGTVPTGSARSYTFLPDSKKQGFIGLCTDDNYVNMLELEKKCVELMYPDAIKKYYGKKVAYEPFLSAFDIAVDNARSIGATKGDTMGMSCKKILDKKNIINAKENKNGTVTFLTEYVLLSVDKELSVSSCIIDSSSNKITLTPDGKIFGSRENEIHTVVDLSNPYKYSKVEKKVLDERVQYNVFSDIVKNNTINGIITLISGNTDSKGQWNESNGYNFDKIDFLTLIELFTDAFLQARSI